jgi:hypothetical protein
MVHSHLMFKSMLNENLGGIPRWQPMLNGWWLNVNWMLA